MCPAVAMSKMTNNDDGINLNYSSHRTSVKVRQCDKRQIQLLQLTHVKRGRSDGCDDDESESYGSDSTASKVNNEYDILGFSNLQSIH
jgi:hypothetical protein